MKMINTESVFIPMGILITTDVLNEPISINVDILLYSGELELLLVCNH